MDTNGMSPDGSSNPADAMLSQDLGMSTGAESPMSNPLLGESGTGQAGMTQGFKFAGKEYKDQSAAEKSFQKLYGKYSENQNIINTVKKALNNPDLMESLSEDPAWADIFAKLGIDMAVENAEKSGMEDEESSQNPNMDRVYQEWQVEREEFRLEREQSKFEKKLGRDLSRDEQTAILRIISRASSLTFEEAWKLAMHDKLLAQQNQARAAANPQKPASNRPAPPPVRTPGAPAPGRKGVAQMSNSEWKDNLANDPEIRELLSRRGG